MARAEVEDLRINLREAWDGMNALLGQRVYITDGLNLREFDPERAESRYILTPDEVRAQIRLSIFSGVYANPDPTDLRVLENLEIDHSDFNGETIEKEDAILLLGETSRESVSLNNEPSVIINQTPRYWLARPIYRDGLNVDHGKLENVYATPMHVVEEVEGIAVVHYVYGVHANSGTHNLRDPNPLIKKMSRVGMPKLKRKSF
jgi:hypothetical protein